MLEMQKAVRCKLPSEIKPYQTFLSFSFMHDMMKKAWAEFCDHGPQGFYHTVYTYCNDCNGYCRGYRLKVSEMSKKEQELAAGVGYLSPLLHTKPGYDVKELTDKYDWWTCKSCGAIGYKEHYGIFTDSPIGKAFLKGFVKRVPPHLKSDFDAIENED